MLRLGLHPLLISKLRAYKYLRNRKNHSTASVWPQYKLTTYGVNLKFIDVLNKTYKKIIVVFACYFAHVAVVADYNIPSVAINIVIKK